MKTHFYLKTNKQKKPFFLFHCVYFICLFFMENIIFVFLIPAFTFLQIHFVHFCHLQNTKLSCMTLKVEFFSFSFSLSYFFIKKSVLCRRATFFLKLNSHLKVFDSNYLLSWEFIRDNMWWGSVSPPSSEYKLSFYYCVLFFNLKGAKYHLKVLMHLKRLLNYKDLSHIDGI